MSCKRMLPLILVAMAISGTAVAQEAAEPRQVPTSMLVPLEKSRQAIEQCRQQRLRGELASYKASAECSSPKIFAAWREANYPHMDLITAWVNEREVASERVDQRTMTPKEFDLKMVELTNRLTAEERRRTSGLLQADNNALQLPPSAPASQAKRTAAARGGRAIDPSSVETMETVSPLNTPPARSGVGGPFVPVGGPEPALTRTASSGGATTYVALASEPSEAEATNAFHSLQRAFPNILRRLHPIIRPIDAANPESAYRVQLGPFNNTAANELCGKMRAAGANCSVQYN